MVAAVRAGNNDVGGRLVEFTGREYMVRGRGYARSPADLESLSLAVSPSGVPVLVRDVGTVTLGPDIRRGVADLDGKGEVVSGIIVMRQGENALRVIDRVKAKLKELEPGLPAGVKIVTAYDRSELILASIDNLKHTLTEELIVVGLVILIFLWHIPSALIPILTIPDRGADLLHPDARHGDELQHHVAGRDRDRRGRDGGCRDRGGGADAQETRRGRARVGRTHDYQRAIVNAVKEVGGPSFFALLVIAVSFLPVLTLEAQEGRLFKPLAYTKNFAMVVGRRARDHARPGAAALLLPQGELSHPGLSREDHQRHSGRQDPLRREASRSAAC